MTLPTLELRTIQIWRIAMSSDLALSALLEARDAASNSVPEHLLAAILAIEKQHAFSSDDNAPLLELEKLIDQFLNDGAAP
jgi:hypothetical protein